MASVLREDRLFLSLQHDNPEATLSLFKVVNIIVEYMINQPDEIDRLFSTILKGAKKSIEKRDILPKR